MAKHEYIIHYGCFGNGLVAYDINSIEHGDYANIAHIDGCGAYRLYKTRLPANVVDDIIAHAKDEAKHFHNVFVNDWLERRLDMIDNAMTWDDKTALQAAGVKLYYLDPEQQLAYYYHYFCKNAHYTPLPGMEVNV